MRSLSSKRLNHSSANFPENIPTDPSLKVTNSDLRAYILKDAHAPGGVMNTSVGAVLCLAHSQRSSIAFRSGNPACGVSISAERIFLLVDFEENGGSPDNNSPNLPPPAVRTRKMENNIATSHEPTDFC